MSYVLPHYHGICIMLKKLLWNSFRGSYDSVSKMPCTVTVENPCQLVCLYLPAIFSNDRRAREKNKTAGSLITANARGRGVGKRALSSALVLRVRIRVLVQLILGQKKMSADTLLVSVLVI